MGGPSASRAAWPLTVYRCLLALVLLAVLGRTLAFHRGLIEFPYPADLSEPSQGILAAAVGAGFSTGDPRNLPGLSDCYGPFYPLVTGSLRSLGFACSLQGLRLLSALFIALVLALLAAICRKAKAGWLETAAVGLWAYELLLIHFTPIARPDALGTLLWFAGLALPFLAGAGALSLAAAALLFTAAGLTKLYFLTGPLLLGLSLLRRPRSFWLFSLMQGLALALAATWLARDYPFDPYVAVLSQVGNTVFDRAHMLFQVRVILGVASPFFAVFLVAAWFARKSGKAVGSGTPGATRTGTGAVEDGAVWGLYGAVGLLLFVEVLGGATGGLFTYLVQLSMLPFAAWFAFSFHPWPKGRLILVGLMALNAACASRVAVHQGFDAGSPVLRNWEKADALVRGARQPVVSSDLDLSVEARGLPVFDTGLSDFSWLPGLHLDGWKARCFPRLGELKRIDQAWRDRTRAALEDPRTDLVEVSDYGHYGFADILQARFRPWQRIQVAYPQCGGAVYWLSFYVPKSPLQEGKASP